MKQVFFQAPLWVWPLLLVLIALGKRMAKTRSVPPQPTYVISSIMLCLSGYGVIIAFQASLPALLAWTLFLTATALACQSMGYPRDWRFDRAAGRLHIPGSWMPLALFMAIFLIKFAVGASLAIHPALASHPPFFLSISALYGTLSGIFAARAWYAWRISRV